MAASYPCPCCGHLTFAEPPGSYEICPVCFWEDDQVQLRWPDYSGGANKPSLIRAQRTFAESGVCELRLLQYVRPATKDEPLESAWRPVDITVDNFEPLGIQQTPWPQDLSILYWWRPTFWRARNG